MEYDEAKYPEPPELKRMGAPPLLIQLRYMLMLFTAAFIIALVFAIIFRLTDG
ncbi:MAG TPA: hypothetical protein VFI29_14135 [Hanamia sp.]|nr:hypothetical protein [Hanamia sp.]